ncbi:MAG: SPFH domain-containing protein [Clostridia bacterium]|nr:SPFH domain-containing protein [Clostridia bacterium]
MGLISAGLNALGGTLASQWREYFYCDSMPVNVLATKAMKRVNGRFGGSRTEDDNVISDGSVIVVNEGQCMMIVEQGKIVDFCAEPGEYKFELNGEPTLLYGDFNTDKLMNILKTTFDRFSFGGQAGKDQRVYYFNTKELTGNKYGTPTAIPFRVVDQNIGLDIDVGIRCFGEYSYRIVNPMAFYVNVCGNVTGDYTRDQLEGQMRTELLTALQPAFAKIGEKGIRYSALPGHALEIADALNEVLSAKWTDLRGIEIVSFGVSSVTPNPEDEAMVKELQRNAVFRNANMAAAHMVGAQAQAMQDAAKNEGGAMTGFMGMNMAAMNGGMNASQLFQMGQQQQQQAAQQPNPNAWKCSCGATATGKFCPECGAKKPEPKPAGGWKCPSCGAEATGKFCPECGAKKPADEGWTCTCGAVNKGKFCAECGAKRPAGAPVYQCDKCGWKPADPTKAPRFCPECGDPFDENDVK